MYDIIQALAIVIYIVFFVLYARHFNVSKLKAFILSIAGMIIYLILVKFLAWAEGGFQEFGPENGIRVYVLLPIFIYGLAKVAKVDPIKMFDMQAAACVLMYGVSHLACIFAGCCHGFQYAEGSTMYNIAYALTGTNMLPLQLFEALTGLLVFALVYFIGWKKKYQTHGYLLCIWYLTFGTARFFWEFLRDNNKVIRFSVMENATSAVTEGGVAYFGISNLAIWAALMVLAGVILLFVFRYIKNKKEKQENIGKETLPQTEIV